MKNFTDLINKKLIYIASKSKLFRSSLSGDKLWETYLNSFNSDPVFRDPNSSSHNCNLCKNFIRRYGNIVGIIDNIPVSIFDVELSNDNEYYNVAKNLSTLIKNNPIGNVFFETFEELNKLNYEKCNKKNNTFRLGIHSNHKTYSKEEVLKYGNVIEGHIYTFNHLYLNLPTEYVSMNNASVESIMGDFRSSKEVFKRGLDEIPASILETVIDLINQDSILDGKTHLHKIEKILPLKKEYDLLPENQKDNYCWVKSYNFPLSRFKNELIGVLCSELASGIDINVACTSWNKRVDPLNYMKAVAPITKQQKDLAEKFVVDNGYVESFDRRFANINDISISDILHANTGKEVKVVSLFDSVKVKSDNKTKDFKNVEEVSIENFMNNILPNCTSVEAYLTNTHEKNMVTLTTTNNPESKPIFKWSNNFSWTYNGNLAGKSQIKENVKLAGGKIVGTLRASLQWNDEDTKASIDYDLHCFTPKSHISYLSKRCLYNDGYLDVDMIHPTKIGNENIIFQKELADGDYRIMVHHYSHSRINKGFKVEIEFDGNIYNYFYSKSTSAGSMTDVATIRVKNGIKEIIHHLPEQQISSKTIYNLETNNFHKANLICLSPNYWKDNVGNKHYFFFLENCKTTDKIRSFHNENFNNELLNHRKVLDVLGNSRLLEPSENQLTGLGFNSTVRDELIVKVGGNFNRVLKIKF